MHGQADFTLASRLRVRRRLTLDRLLGFDDRSTTLIVAAGLLIGVGIRTANNAIRAKAGAGGEAAHVAEAIAQGRGFADAFDLGQGATAHLLPVSPGIAGLVYSLLGVRSLPAEIVLATWSIMLAMGSYVVFSHVFKRIGVTDRARAGALLYLALIPVYLRVEAVDFRIWEGALAAMLSALLLMQATSDQPARTNGQTALLALNAALLFFVNPIVGIGGFACLAWLALTRWNIRKTTTVFALTVVLAAAFVAPWAIRNHQALGVPIALRSNAGLELAVGTDPAMLGNEAPNQVYHERLARIHPMQSPAAFEMVKQIGEVRYARLVGEQTKKWILENPGLEARILLLHLRQTFAPEPWVFRIWGKSRWPVEQSVLVTLVGVAGLAGVFTALVRRRRNWCLVAIMILVPAIAMSPFQPITRYIYAYHAILTFPAVEALLWLFRKRSLLQAKLVGGSGRFQLPVPPTASAQGLFSQTEMASTPRRPS